MKNYVSHNADIVARYYFTCCRSGPCRINKSERKTTKLRPNQKESRKLNITCISRMYTDEYKNGSVSVKYISAHSGHDLGPQELKCLPLPSCTKEEVAVKLAIGIPPNRILKG